MVKQWTSKCKQLKEEHSRVLDDRGRRQQDSATALRKSENEVARLKSELEDMTNSWKEEVASLRRDRMKERKRAESEAARATELAEEAMRSTVESDAISSKLEAAERSAKHVERLTREQAETREELDRIRSEHESLSSSRAADQTKISALTLERDELAREVCPSLKTKKVGSLQSDVWGTQVDETNSEWESLQREMARIKDQLGQAIHGGEAAFLDLTAAKEDSKRLEERLSAKEADVAALQQEQGDSQPRPIVISYVVLRHAFAGGAGRLREELSSSCGVVERANRSAEELRTTLEEERRKMESVQAELKTQREAASAAEAAALRAHEAAEDTVRGMMTNLRRKLDEMREKTVAEVAKADTARKDAETRLAEQQFTIESASKERMLLSQQLDSSRAEANRLRSEFNVQRRQDHSKRLGTIDMLMTEASGLARRLEEAKAEAVRETATSSHATSSSPSFVESDLISPHRRSSSEWSSVRAA